VKVFAAMFCPCIHESEFKVLSLHASEEGAQAAVDKAIKRELRNWGGKPRVSLPNFMKFDVKPMRVGP
jgi:hypothetical protein